MQDDKMWKEAKNSVINTFFVYVYSKRGAFALLWENNIRNDTKITDEYLT